MIIDLGAPTLIDLFAGAGGMSLGFREAGFQPIWAVEKWSTAASTYETNFGAHIVDGDIEDVDEFPAADVIIGGPPCQGFTPLGKDIKSDRRGELNALWRQYIRAVAQTRPKVFVLENVPQLLRSKEFASLTRRFSRDPLLRDYRLESRVLNAADFGVPQHRRRAIVIGSRLGVPLWPDATQGDGSIGPAPYVTVEEAIADLSAVPDGKNLHVGRNPTALSLDRYRVIPPGGNRFDLARKRPDLLPPCWHRKKTGSTDVFGRLWWDRPSVTIRTEFHKPEKGRYLHPTEDRPITLREAARLQSFPDDFSFVGSYTAVAKQIGNAVPPLLARHIAQAVLRHLSGIVGSASPEQVRLALTGR